MAACVKSSTFTHWTFVASSFFQYLMTSSEFTEHFPGLSKVPYYPISDRKDFNFVLTSVLGWQNYINVWCIIVWIYDVLL